MVHWQGFSFSKVVINVVSTLEDGDILLSFGAPYSKLIGITLVIAFLVSFCIVNLWLVYFILKIDFGVWFAFWLIVIISAISLLLFGYYVGKVVIQDPIKILKDD